MKNQLLVSFINSPTKAGTAKTKSSIDSITSTFKRFIAVTGYTEDELASGMIDEHKVIQLYKDLKLTPNAGHCALKYINAYLNQDPANLQQPELNEYLQSLYAENTLKKGEVRSDEEHEKGYAHIDSSIIHEAMLDMNKDNFDLQLYLQLVAIGIMECTPIRPSELVQVRVGTEERPIEPTDSWYDWRIGVLYIHEANQKSTRVGARKIEMPPHVTTFLKKFLGRRAGTCLAGKTYLFPSFRKCDEGSDVPVKRHDFTNELVKPITERLAGKALSARSVRTSVISDKVATMNPKQRMDFAQKCGHTLNTQKDQYAVFDTKKTQIVVTKKALPAPVQAQAQPQVVVWRYEAGILLVSNVTMEVMDKIIDKLDGAENCKADSESKAWSFKIKLELKDAHALIKMF